jgi:hypothetical protein
MGPVVGFGFEDFDGYFFLVVEVDGFSDSKK